MADEVILTSVSDRVATLTLNRPEKLNALSEDLSRRSIEVLTEWGRDPEIGAIVVTGAGRAFCAGGDVSNMGREGEARLTLEQRVDRLRVSHQFPWLLHSLPKVTIAAVNGFAMGAGLGICLACDLRIAAEPAKFGTAYAKVGLGGDYGVTWMLTHLAGPAKAKELFFTADIIDAAEALRIGLVNRVVAPDALAAHVQEFAARIAHGPQTSFRYMKANVNLATMTDFRTMLDREPETHLRCAMTEDHREGVRAFMEKRAPTFRGK
jgi:2-(1,2-epoxy-1,2-dihydrophenyl)acetyl-CoA isomerase